MENKCKKTDLKTVEKCELNAEQIKKTLECCVLGDCTPCPYHQFYVGCLDRMAEDALSLINSQEQRIKELTEEVEKDAKVFDDLLKEAETYLAQRECLRNLVKNLTAENERLNASCTELARKMQDNVRAENEELRKSSECDVRKLKADTVRKMQERLKTEFKDWLGIPYIIDQIAKEMLEGG